MIGVCPITLTPRVCSTKTRIKTVCSTSGLDCQDRKLSHDIHNIVTDAMRRIFDKAEIHGYSYSRDHKVLRLTIDQEDRLIKREDLEKICEFITTANMSPEIMRSVISVVDRSEFSDRLYKLMVEYAM